MPPLPCHSVYLQGSDNADLEISHAFDADTDVKVEVSSKSMTTPSVEVSRRFVSLCVLVSQPVRVLLISRPAPIRGICKLICALTFTTIAQAG